MHICIQVSEQEITTGKWDTSSTALICPKCLYLVNKYQSNFYPYLNEIT